MIIAKIFKTKLVPNLLFGLEFAKLNRSDLDKISRSYRTVFKELLSISKFSRNIVLDALNVEPFEIVYDKQILNSFNLLTKNNVTNRIVCNSLGTARDKNSQVTKRTEKISFLEYVHQVCLKHDLNMIRAYIRKSVKNITYLPDPEKRGVIDSLKYIFQNLHLKKNRLLFRNLIMDRVLGRELENE